jgi:hypothetical protein
MFFEIDIQGNLQDYLGIHINHHNDGTITMTQPHLIDSILSDLNPTDKHENKSTSKALPSMPTCKIHADPKGPPFSYPWNYQAIIGKLNFLAKSTQPNITYIVHQLASQPNCNSCMVKQSNTLADTYLEHKNVESSCNHSNQSH